MLKSNSANEEYNSRDKADNPGIYGDSCRKKTDLPWDQLAFRSFKLIFIFIIFIIMEPC